MNRSPIARWRWAAWAAIAIHFAAFLLLGLSRHWNYLTSVNDLGVFDQAVWGTLNGELLRNTSQLNQPINWLGFHFHPVLLLFVPLYALSPSAEWFVLAQVAALSFSAWPMFLLASRVCQSEKTGMLWTLAYLVNPFLLSAAAWDFHPVALAVPFMALGMLAVAENKRPLMLLACLPLLFIQEHFGLAVAGFGLLWAFHNRDWKFGVALVGIGIAHAALVLGVVMPALSPSGGHPMFSGIAQQDRYGWLGKSAGEAIGMVLGDPLRVAKIAIFDFEGGLYIFLLLVPLLFLPLAASAFLLPGLADLAANLLSATPMPRSLVSYHSVSLLPLLAAAAIFGARRISARVKKFSLPEISGLALVASLIMGYQFAPFPLPGASNIWAPKGYTAVPENLAHTLGEKVGQGASLSVQANVGAHFSQRRDVYAYPNKAGVTDAIVLRLDSPTRNFRSSDPDMIATLASHLRMRPAEYLASIECLLSGGGYGVALWQDPWLVFSRDRMKNNAFHRDVELKLLRLRQEWGITADEYSAALETCKRLERY